MTTFIRTTRNRLAVKGTVQGVGFRPFVYRLAESEHLTGWVANDSSGVIIEVEGDVLAVENFKKRLAKEHPPACTIQSTDVKKLPTLNGYEKEFIIRPSLTAERKTALILPDLAVCPECLNEIFDKGNRRYLYPFTNCTHCGPRYSIITALPYDRPYTTMKIFTMCPSCREEYQNPRDRRFHAQPNACPACGPHLELWTTGGKVMANGHDALLEMADSIRMGRIAAIKGLGGFHLVVDARNGDAVQRLRRGKKREEKPLAIMAPDMTWIENYCQTTPLEKEILLSSASPIVLLAKINDAGVAAEVAPNNPALGVMLPYTPLHHILMRELGFPIVATSGNLTDEPICIDELEACERLQDIADLFLIHDRPIARPVDDSVVRIMGGREMIIRRARGYAPLPIILDRIAPPCLAVGAHLKNSVAITIENQVVLSQHIGDMETPLAFESFRRTINHLTQIYENKPGKIACDLHPDYQSTQYAKKYGGEIITVQHHYAHILSCMADNNIEPPLLGVAWDGTGYGPDGTIWGGEFLSIDEKGYNRLASLRRFPLPGGEKAIKEPRRSALGLLYELYAGDESKVGASTITNYFQSNELSALEEILAQKLNCPETSSVGRLFDAVAALLNIRLVNNFEGQAAMELEFLLGDFITEEAYDIKVNRVDDLDGQPGFILDWQDMILAIMEDFAGQVEPRIISARFHNALAKSAVAIAQKAGREKVVLSGGCFQNKYLTEKTILLLRQADFTPYWHRQVPPNDGGIALGQIAAAIRVNDKG